MNRSMAVFLILLSCNFWSIGLMAKSAESHDYVPGLGEIMSLLQMRHIKLWFAGRAHNWSLVAYEIDELREGFNDAVKFHPEHKDSPVPISEILPRLVAGPLDSLEQAASANDEEKFTKSFDALTQACNTCHQEENFGFNVIVRPQFNPYTNQSFSSSKNSTTGRAAPDNTIDRTY